MGVGTWTWRGKGTVGELHGRGPGWEGEHWLGYMVGDLDGKGTVGLGGLHGGEREGIHLMILSMT